MNKENKLKPCPFCGETAMISAFPMDYPSEHSRAYVKCQNCGAEINIDGRIEETKSMVNKCVEMWNKRMETNQPIRCKDCQNYVKIKNFDNECGITGGCVDDMHYCSYAERRVAK